MTINPDCPCTNKTCPRRTMCDLCHKAHEGTGYPVACEKHKS